MIAFFIEKMRSTRLTRIDPKKNRNNFFHFAIYFFCRPRSIDNMNGIFRRTIPLRESFYFIEKLLVPLIHTFVIRISLHMIMMSESPMGSPTFSSRCVKKQINIAWMKACAPKIQDVVSYSPKLFFKLTVFLPIQLICIRRGIKPICNVAIARRERWHYQFVDICRTRRSKRKQHRLWMNIFGTLINNNLSDSFRKLTSSRLPRVHDFWEIFFQHCNDG